MPAFGTRCDILTRQLQRRRASNESTTLGVEVLEQKARLIRIAAVTAIRTAQWLYGAARRRSECIAAPVSQVPVTVGSAIEAVPAAPDESHGRTQANVAAQRSVEGHLKSLCAGH